jgi:Acyclic terpene utilisation family protein AtuA
MKRRKNVLRLGGGSACPGERLEPAIELIEKGNIDYIIFDSLSESEMLAFERHKLTHPDQGYDVYTEARLRAILPLCARHNVKIIGNMGGANPRGCQELALRIARELGLKGMKTAAVLGDNVLNLVKELNSPVHENGKGVNDFADQLIAAHAYIPADPIVEALNQGACIVITGRVGDASLYLAPMRFELGWTDEDRDLLAKGIVIGHLFECAGQLTGGYFADPPYKVVPDLHRLGFPIAELQADGETVITKVEDSGGLVSPATCAEQMLYEVHDPANYIEADVIADLSDVGFDQVGPNRVAVTGVIKGKPKPELLKVNLGVREGYMAEGTIFYAGPGALERAQLAADVIRKRLELVTHLKATALRFDFIGVNSLYGPPEKQLNHVPWEVGLRVAGRTQSSSEAWKIMHELETIDNNGPAGIARGLRKEETREILGYYSTFIPRGRVTTEVVMREA